MLFAVRSGDGREREKGRGVKRPFDVRVRGHDVVEAGHLVRRLLPGPTLPMVGPFVLFDHFGPATLAPGDGVEIAPHRHAHLATVTYLFAGATHHTDDLGNDVVVEAGDVAWMHAAAGIVHAERTPAPLLARGGLGHGIQAWTALPEALERSAPRYQWARATEIPRVVRGGVTVRVLVGEAFGVRSPIETVTSVVLWELRAGDERAELPLDPGPGQHALLFVDGFGALDGHRIGVGTLVRLCEGETPQLTLEAGATALFFGGTPLGTRLLQGNVIGSSVERLEQALREARALGLTLVGGPSEKGANERWSCPCCDCFTLAEEPPGTFAICAVCGWEDDGAQHADPDLTGGANAPSLRSARRHYLETGAADPDHRAATRPPRADEKP